MREPSKKAGEGVAMGMAAFQSLLEQYGAEPRRWPDHLRSSALALLDSSAEARDEQHRAALLDAVLDRLEAPAVSDERVARVVAGALADLPVPGLVRKRISLAQRVADILGPWRVIWLRTAGLAACTAAGILVGTFTPAVNATAQGVTNVAAATDLPSAMFTPSAVESLFQ